MVIKKSQKKSDIAWLIKGLGFLEPVFASIRDGVFITTPDGTIMLANPVVEVISGILPADLLGLKIQEAFNFKSKKVEISKFFKEALQGWSAVELPQEVELLQPQGRSVPIAANATPLYDPKGNYAGVVFVIRDITEEVQRRKEQYEFLSFVSHQFRQPLGALRWGIEVILENPNLTGEEKETLNDLQKVVLRFKNFINDLIDMTHLNKGTLELKRDSVDIRDVAQSVADELKGIAESQNVRMILFPNAKTDEKFIIPGDRSRLVDVFSNLISNSIFYNQPRGEVRVDAKVVDQKFLEVFAFKKQGSVGLHDYFRKVAEQDNKNFLLVSVTDTGLGIPEAEQPKIFESFYRAANVIKKGIAGTGLGLFIVKAIVERSSGKILFESKENLGTTFYIIFPTS